MRVVIPLAALLVMLVASVEASAGLQSALLTHAYWGSPVANYNPRTGNITLTNFTTLETATESPLRQLEVIRRFEILSLGTALQIDAAQAPSGGTVEPVTAIAYGIAWSAPTFPKPFDAGNVVPPGTPVGSLVFQYGADLGAYVPIMSPVNMVPEPSAVSIAACCPLGLSLIRRRPGRLWRLNQSGHPCP
jgi:hypothetical protein